MSVERTFIPSVVLFMAACSWAVATPVDDHQVSRVMRRFRMQTFQSYRSDRAEYDRRVRYAQSVLDTWRRLGAPPSERSSLIDFLTRATFAAQRGQPMPKFEFSSGARSAKVRRPPKPSRSERRSQRPDNAIVAPPVPALPRQPDRDWSALRDRPPNDAVSSPSTIRLESRVPRAMRYRIAARPAPASLVPQPRANQIVSAARTSESAVDLTLLAARIRASNLKLSEVESELMARGDWDVQRLEPLVRQFDEILSGRRVSRLYYEALNDSERKQLFTAISPPQPVLSLLSQRWFEARVASADGGWPKDDVANSRLERIARTIDMWKSEYPGYRN